MANKTAGISVKGCLIFSITLHLSLFLLYKPSAEYRKVIYYSSIPVQLMPRGIPEGEKKETPKTDKKETKKVIKNKDDKVSVKDKNKTNNAQQEAKSAKTVSQPDQKQPQGSPDGAPGARNPTSLVTDYKGFPYLWYLNGIENKINESWIMPSRLQEWEGKKAVVYFRIQRGGEISDIKVETSSGEPNLDLSGLRAVQESAPFPPLPSGFDEEYLIVHFYFEIQ
jgi:TonB family protein